MDEFSIEEVQAFLAGHYRGRAGRASAIGAGDWSRAYSFQLGGGERVIRFGNYREDFDKDRIMAAYASAQLPVPPIHEIGAAAGRFFAVSERAHGTYLDSLEEAEMREVLPSLFATLDALHRLPVPGSGFGMWDGSGNANEPSWQRFLLSVTRETDRVPGWRQFLDSLPGTMDTFEAGLEALRERCREVPDVRTVVHADLLNRNVLVSGSTISAVLDWGSSLYGDWLYDYAWLIYCWPWYDPLSGIDIRAEIENHLRQRGEIGPDFEQRLVCCLLHIGLNAQAYNGFKRDAAQLEINSARTLSFARGV